MSMSPQDKEGIGRLVADIVRLCLESDVGGVYSVFALGIAASALRSINEGAPDLTADQRDEVLRVLTAGVGQQVVVAGSAQVEGVVFGGILDKNARKH